MVFLSSKIPNEIKNCLKEIVSTQWKEILEISDSSDIKKNSSNANSIFFIWQESTNISLLSEFLNKFPNAITILLYRDNEQIKNQEITIGKMDVNFSFRYESLNTEILSVIKEIIQSKILYRKLENKYSKLEETIVEWKNIFQDSLDLIFIIESETKRILQTNRTSMMILGYTEDELIGMDFSLLTKPPKSENLDGADFQGSTIINQGLRNSEGKWIPMESTWRLLQKNDETSILATFRDITERKEAEKKINQLAFYNSITNLPNRAHFENVVKNLTIISRKNKEQFAIVILDIDNFKLINESIGPERGNALLKLVGEKLSGMNIFLTEISHFGGDEFAGIIKNFKDNDSLEIKLIQLQHQLRNPYLFEDREFYITMSIGVAIYPDHADQEIDLIKSADMAMYSAKDRGRNLYSLYSNKMIEKVQFQLELENDMRTAIKLKEFEVYFQPQVNLQTGEICGAEALIRWNHPAKGIVYPGNFISIAEESGIIFDIGIYVLKQTCRIASEWHKNGIIQFPISVNISAKQWNGLGISKEILRILDEHKLPTNFLTIEITESSVMQNPEQSILEFKELTQNGICLSVDDFGTGYSSLSYLKKLHVHHLKIDRSFIKDLETNENDRAICKAIINMAHSLGLQVIAEGVETKDQWRILQEEGCNIMQGYFISQALPQKEFEDLLMNYRFKNYEKFFAS
jgi:diguanylate cyclase (GGDEF)-like protein/PAS domain S-box-containing protein